MKLLLSTLKDEYKSVKEPSVFTTTSVGGHVIVWPKGKTYTVY